MKKKDRTPAVSDTNGHVVKHDPGPPRSFGAAGGTVSGNTGTDWTKHESSPWGGPDVHEQAKGKQKPR